MNEFFPGSMVDEKGYFGNFGGAYIPEMLYQNIEELKEKYFKIIEQQEFQKKYINMLESYVGRPTPLYHAKRLSEKYKCNIYLKREDLCHTGSHKINNTIGQILLANFMGKKRIIAETGAGQHGVATATVCALLDLECVVYMGAVDIKRQAPNVQRMKMLGAQVIPAKSGSKTLKDATNEALRDWIANPDSYYLIGSVVGPHPYPDMVARFQSIISKEIKEQFRRHSDKNYPDYIIACVGGGSNSIGAFYHFVDNKEVKLIGVEAGGQGIHSGKTAATISVGSEGVLHGSKTILMQTEDGQVVEPFSISAGLDYPGVGPVHSFMNASGMAKYLNVTDEEALSAGITLSKLEGIIPALESAHAFAALDKIEGLQGKNVVINLSGRGEKDMGTYSEFCELTDFAD